MTEPSPDLPPHMDPARFDALLESVGPEEILVIIARAMGPALRGRFEPEDVWQETLASAWKDRATHTWESPTAYRRWLVVIAKNRIHDLARAGSRLKRGGENATGLFSERKPAESVSLADVLPAGSVTPSRVAQHNERSRLMLAALDELPADVEPVVRLHLFEDRTMESIAEELGIHLAAAWRRLRKGVTIYRERLVALEAASRLPLGGGA
ncbi:MAG: RNA polymerase sigma factor [Planctomycetes bacterium]|nr:RNA polymerase sigma factor [Planctomycetota bacterium]